MKIAVLEPASSAARLQAAQREVFIGTRDPQARLSRTKGDTMGNPPFGTWHAKNAEVGLLAFPEAGR